jgi:hypothetical protein
VEEVGDPGPEEESGGEEEPGGEEGPVAEEFKAGQWVQGKASKRGQFDGQKAKVLRVTGHKVHVVVYGTWEEKMWMKGMCFVVPSVAEDDAEYDRRQVARAKEETVKEAVTKGADVATRARKGAAVVAAKAATRSRKVATVGAARAPRKRKRPDQAEVGTPLGAVIKLLPTDGLVGLGEEVMQELAVRIRRVEE